MTQAVITVAHINQPEQGKKQGKVIDTQGNKWNVWADKLQNYREGVTYEINYEENEFKGVSFKVIKTANPTNAAPKPGSITPSNDGWPGPNVVLRAAAPQPMVGFTAKDEMIFVCGIINNAISNTNINPFEVTLTEMIAMVDKCRSTWRNTLGKTQKADDLNDEIPDFK